MTETKIELREKVILVTGAGKGIGRAFSLSLLEAGASVACCSRSPKDLEKLAEESKGFSGKLLTACFDIRDYSATESFIGRIEDRFGRLDCAIINAGVTTENATVEKSSLDKWAEAIDINLVGSMKTAKSVIPLMKKSKHGNIIFIGSGLGHRGVVGTSSYSCAKAGLWMLTRILSQELLEDNILVNELIPGPVDTDIDRNILQRHSTATFSAEWKKQPMDVVPLMKFMVSFPEKGPTGQTFSMTRREI